MKNKRVIIGLYIGISKRRDVYSRLDPFRVVLRPRVMSLYFNTSRMSDWDCCCPLPFHHPSQHGPGVLPVVLALSRRATQFPFLYSL